MPMIYRKNDNPQLYLIHQYDERGFLTILWTLNPFKATQFPAHVKPHQCTAVDLFRLVCEDPSLLTSFMENQHAPTETPQDPLIHGDS